MKRTDAAGAAAGNLFTDGNPGTGTPATVVDASWLNAVQEELCSIIEGFGGTLNPAANNQLLTLLDARYPRMPAGTRAVFHQAAAPPGWVQDAAHNNKALRVVSGVGGGAGGTHGLSTPPSTAHTHTGPSHSHDMSSHTHVAPSHSHDMSNHYHAGGVHSHIYTEVVAHNHTFTGNPMGGHDHGIWMSGADGSSQGVMVSGTAHPATGRWSSDRTGFNSAGTPTGSIGTTGWGSPSTQDAYSGNTGGPSNNSTGLAGGSATGGPSNNSTGAAGTGATGSASPTAFAPLYIDVIVCQRS